MDFTEDLSNLLAVNSTIAVFRVADVILVSYFGYRSDVVGVGARPLVLALVFVFFAAGDVTVAFVAFPSLGQDLYLQINPIG